MLVSFYPYSMFNRRLKNHTLFSTTSHQFSTAPQWFFRRHDDQRTGGASAPQLALSTTHPAGHVQQTWYAHPPLDCRGVFSTSTPRASDTVPRETRPRPGRPRSRPPNGTLPLDLARTPPSWTPVSHLDTPSHARSQDPTLEAIKQKRLAELGGMEGMPQARRSSRRAKRRLRRGRAAADLFSRGRSWTPRRASDSAESPWSSRIRPRRSKTCCCRRREGSARREGDGGRADQDAGADQRSAGGGGGSRRPRRAQDHHDQAAEYHGRRRLVREKCCARVMEGRRARGGRHAM